MLADKTGKDSNYLYQIQPRSSTYEDYLDAKAEMNRKCSEHAEFVRECRRKKINAYLSQKLINDLKPISDLENIPDDPKPSNNENYSNRNDHQIFIKTQFHQKF